jgi:hypothetical protein
MEERPCADWLPLVISDRRDDSGKQGRNGSSLHSLSHFRIQDLVQKKVAYLIQDLPFEALI